jgi:hypothetical protein
VKLRELVNRMLGRHRESPDVTPQQVRDLIRERQIEQEARLRSLDVKAGLSVHRRQS